MEISSMYRYECSSSAMFLISINVSLSRLFNDSINLNLRSRRFYFNSDFTFSGKFFKNITVEIGCWNKV